MCAVLQSANERLAVLEGEQQAERVVKAFRTYDRTQVSVSMWVSRPCFIIWHMRTRLWLHGFIILKRSTISVSSSYFLPTRRIVLWWRCLLWLVQDISRAADVHANGLSVQTFHLGFLLTHCFVETNDHFSWHSGRGVFCSLTQKADCSAKLNSRHISGHHRVNLNVLGDPRASLLFWCSNAWRSIVCICIIWSCLLN